VASEALGFFYAYSYDMNDEPVPFQREKTSQSHTMLLHEGRPFLVLESAGGARIPDSIVRTAVNVVDHGQTLEDALSARRCFITRTTPGISAVCTPCWWTRSPTCWWEEAIPETMGPPGGASTIGELPDYIIDGASEILMHKRLDRS